MKKICIKGFSSDERYPQGKKSSRIQNLNRKIKAKDLSTKRKCFSFLRFKDLPFQKKKKKISSLRVFLSLSSLKLNVDPFYDIKLEHSPNVMIYIRVIQKKKKKIYIQ